MPTSPLTEPLLVNTEDLVAAYQAAQESAILLDRGAEGRLELTGADRLNILHRISTNAVEALAPGEGRATVLTTPIGRIIDRVILHNLTADRTLLRTSPGRAEQITAYLRRNIFFRDKMRVEDVSAAYAQLALYGPGSVALAYQAAGEVAAAHAAAGEVAAHHVVEAAFAGGQLYLLGLEPLTVPGLALLVPVEAASALRDALLAGGAHPVGDAAYDLLRIEAGRPGLPELNEDYIPLEAALWGDVSFTKGCYTGQEIIARMESRGKLARTLVRVDLSGPVEVGASWRADDRAQGTLTSLARRPDGQWIGLGFVKPAYAEDGQVLTFADGAAATVRAG